ncbi:MAG: hypothetical protein HY402_01115, partial [Elusimicrobia bacterium]|nr:hypothetical protein [Elusimicrobiota bacterium]
DLSIANGDISDQDFSLVPKASGTVSGIAYLGDHLVLSQVVASTVNASNGFNQEYVELYNPTTWTWTLSGSFNLTIFYEKTSPYACKELGFNTAASCALEAGLTFVNSTIASQGYFLIANTDTLRAGGVTVTADAYYDEGVTGNVIEESKGGGVGLLSNNVPLDRAGWTRGNAGESSGPNTTETSGLVLNKGLDPGEQIARAVSSSTVTSTQGNAWDSQNNSSDFNLNVTTVPSANHDMSLTFAPRASASTLVPISGTPARGALISVTDGLSSAATASGSGSFQVVEVATGSWRVILSSGTLFAERLNVSVSASANTGLGSVTLTSSTADGIVSGRVTDGAAGLPNIAVAASGGQDVTNSGGYYSFSIATGTYDVTANPGNQDASYTLGVVTGVVVSVGQIASGVDFALSQGGRLRGFVSTNGVDPLPGVAIDAEQGGLSRGSGISGPDGYFLIGNLPVGTYEVGAYPSSGETVSPSTYSATVASDATVFVGTYTVSGAFGKIAGDLTTGGSAPITIGVLVLASTATISEPPPAINASLRSGAVFYYAVSSFSDGTYELAVPPGSYNLAAWYTTFSGETPTTNRQSGTATVAAGQTQTVDLNW